MNFTREPIIETIITPKDGYKIVVRNSKGAALEEYSVDALEVVSFGSALFYRSLERPKSFLVPVSDYEVVEVKEARISLKNVSLDRAVKIGGGKKETTDKTESSEESLAAEVVTEPKNDKKKERKRMRKRRSSDERQEMKERTSEENQETEVPPVISTLFPPPPSLISEKLARYKEELDKQIEAEGAKEETLKEEAKEEETPKEEALKVEAKEEEAPKAEENEPEEKKSEGKKKVTKKARKEPKKETPPEGEVSSISREITSDDFEAPFGYPTAEVFTGDTELY